MTLTLEDLTLQQGRTDLGTVAPIPSKTGEVNADREIALWLKCAGSYIPNEDEVAQLARSLFVGTGYTLDSSAGELNLPEGTYQRVRECRIKQIKSDSSDGIRLANQLTTSDLTAVLNERRQFMSQIELIAMARSISPSSEAVGMAAIGAVTQFASMDSLVAVYEEVRAAMNSGYELLTPGRGTIADVLVYLANSKQSFGTDKIKNTRTFSDKLVIILDESTLSELEDNSRFRELITSRSVLFVNPVGTIGGINFANCGDSSLIREIASNALQSISTEGQDISQVVKAIETTLNQRVIDRLEDIGIKTNSDKCSVKNCSFKIGAADEIDRALIQINGINRADTSTMTSELRSQFPNDYHREIAHELILYGACIDSHRRLTSVVREQYASIMEIARKKGVKPEDIRYLIPRTNKSYDVAAYFFREANNVESRQFVSLEEIKSCKQITRNSGKYMVVVLDDFAGTGLSLFQDYLELRNQAHFQGHIVLAPQTAAKLTNTVSLPQAGIKYDGMTNLMQRDSRLTFQPVETALPLIDHPGYLRLDSEIRAIFDKTIGKAGFGGTGTMVVKPYMAPNNNIEFVCRMARLFTLNGAGVKNPGK